MTLIWYESVSWMYSIYGKTVIKHSHTKVSWCGNWGFVWLILLVSVIKSKCTRIRFLYIVCQLMWIWNCSCFLKRKVFLFCYCFFDDFMCTQFLVLKKLSLFKTNRKFEKVNFIAVLTWRYWRDFSFLLCISWIKECRSEDTLIDTWNTIVAILS